MGRNLLHRLYAILAIPAVVDSVLGLSTPAHFADVLDCVLSCGGQCARVVNPNTLCGCARLRAQLWWTSHLQEI